MAPSGLPRRELRREEDKGETVSSPGHVLVGIHGRGRGGPECDAPQLPPGSGGLGWGVTGNGYEGLPWGGGNGLKLHRGVGCTTL